MEKQFVTILQITKKDGQSFTAEVYSDSAEQAYIKEKTYKTLVGTSEDYDAIELIGTYKKVSLKVIGE